MFSKQYLTNINIVATLNYKTMCIGLQNLHKKLEAKDKIIVSQYNMYSKRGIPLRPT